MIGCIEKALVHPKRRHRGFTPVELTEGLARMAVNDSNKIMVFVFICKMSIVHYHIF